MHWKVSNRKEAKTQSRGKVSDISWKNHECLSNLGYLACKYKLPASKIWFMNKNPKIISILVMHKTIYNKNLSSIHTISIAIKLFFWANESNKSKYSEFSESFSMINVYIHQKGQN